MRPVQLATSLSVAALLIIGACGGPPTTPQGTGTEALAAEQMEVRGHVVEFKAASITGLESLTLRDESGEIWTFEAEGFVGFTPSHLRDHQAFGLVVTVTYIRTADRLIALNLTD